MSYNKVSNRVIVILAVISSLVMLVLARSYSTYRNHMRVTHAIYGYQLECVRDDRDYFIMQKDKESYTETFWRLWDWGDTRILSPEDYARVKPYVGWYPERKNGQYVVD